MPNFAKFYFTYVGATVCGVCLCTCMYVCVLGVHIKGIFKNRPVSKKLLE